MEKSYLVTVELSTLTNRKETTKHRYLIFANSQANAAAMALTEAKLEPEYLKDKTYIKINKIEVATTTSP